MTRIRTILLLGPPTADTIAAHPVPLLSHILPPFDNPVRVEDHIGTGPFPTLSTFDPDESSCFELQQEKQEKQQKQQQTDKGKRKACESINDNKKRRTVQEKAEEKKEELLQSWRVLLWNKPALHTGFTQRSYLSADEFHQYTQHGAISSSLPLDGNSGPFLDMTSIENSSGGGGDSLLPSSRFAVGNEGEDPYAYLENSYAVHVVPTSQISAYSACDEEDPDRSVGGEEDSFLDDSALSGFTTLRPPLPHIPLGILTNLRDIPTVSAFERLRKTWTVNLLVGIASMPQPRMLKTRSRFQDPDKTEQTEINTLVVGDETSAGFEVNVWLATSSGTANHGNNDIPPLLPSKATDAHPNAIAGMSKVKALRVGDIILLQNIALSTYKGQVFGNTLRRDRSKIILVYRDEKGKRADLSAPDDQQVLKVRMVREWVRDCVYNPYVDGRSALAGGEDYGGAGKKKMVGDSMPDDTQARQSWIEDSF